MFGGSSEIDIKVIVKHEQHIGIIRVFLSAWGNLLSFSVHLGTEKLLGCGLLGGSVHRVALWCIYIGFPTGKDGGRPSHQLKILLSSK